MARIIIIGGTGAVGEATAKRLVSAGHECHLIGRDAERLRAVADPLGASFSVADVTSEAFETSVAEAAGECLDGLLYAVGTITLRPLDKLDVARFGEDMAINAFGAARAVKAAARALKATETTSSVVLFSSIAARQGFAQHVSIGMAKGAVEGLTVSLAAELAPKVRVNAIAPSLVDTPLASGLTASPQLAKGIAAMHPIPRLGTRDDIAAAAAFLLSPESSWISGQIVGIDGGRSSLRVKG